MNLVFNNPLLYIVDYPAENAVEVVDKRVNAGALMQGEAAIRFRHEFQELMEHEPSMEDMEAFIDDYDVSFSHSTAVH